MTTLAHQVIADVLLQCAGVWCLWWWVTDRVDDWFEWQKAKIIAEYEGKL